MRSAITIVDRLVAAGMAGITDASAIHTPPIPWTAPRASTTARWPGSGPIAQVPTGWWYEPVRCRIERASPAVSSSLMAGPGASSEPVTSPVSRGVRLSRQACKVASIIRLISSGWRKWAMSWRGGSAGRAERRRTEPRGRTASSPATMPNTPPAGLGGSSNGPTGNRCRSGGPHGPARLERIVSITWK